MFFSNWQTLLRILVVAPLVYAALVIMLRISGKRTLTQLNAFDFIVTVAFGSTLASTIISTDIGLADGILALFLLVILQLSVAWTSVRVRWSKVIIKSEPRLLLRNGTFLESAMKEERVRREEILQAIRSQGISSVDAVAFVVLETNGKMSVIPESSTSENSALEDVGREKS